jgi:hypothetical protein
MSKQIPNLDKLATLPEMHYLLLKVLDRPDPISWYDLSFSCKEWSFNFAIAFENTITFLELLSIIEVGQNKSVVRKQADYNNLNSEAEFGIFILRKMVIYFHEDKSLAQVFNENTVISDLANDTIAVDVGKMPIHSLFVRVFLLNFGMASPDKNQNGRLLISAIYKKSFWDIIFSNGETRERNTDSQLVPLKMHNFFISYASKDKRYMEKLKKHFSGLIRSNAISEWDGQAILPGADWQEQIKQKLEQANVILFLISAEFMDSDYIHDVELKKAIERYNQGKVRIIPIILRSCDFRSLPISRYQALPTDALPIEKWPNEDEPYFDVVTQIRKMLAVEQKQ